MRFLFSLLSFSAVIEIKCTEALCVNWGKDRYDTSSIASSESAKLVTLVRTC